VYLQNVYIGINVTGKVIRKEYVKKIKRILFRIESPPEFTNEETLSVKRIVFQFALIKKLYRKYKKILYEGNNLSVFGFVRLIATGKTLTGEEIHEYFIDAQSIEEVHISIPTIPEEVQMT
jgi:hypothetical protein